MIKVVINGSVFIFESRKLFESFCKLNKIPLLVAKEV